METNGIESATAHNIENAAARLAITSSHEGLGTQSIAESKKIDIGRASSEPVEISKPMVDQKRDPEFTNQPHNQQDSPTNNNNTTTGNYDGDDGEDRRGSDDTQSRTTEDDPDGLQYRDHSQQPHEATTTTAVSAPTSSSARLKFEEHRLKTHWTLWYLNEKKDIGWMERLKKVCIITTVEQFWALYDNIRPPSALSNGCDYNFFKDGIQPVWEVQENKDGGRLVVQIDKGRFDQLDDLWLELLLALIGEQFGNDSDNICGAVCNFRAKGHKICLWTKNAEAEEVNKRIGSVMKDRFQLKSKGQIRVNYEEHNAAQNKHSSAIQSRFTL